MRVGAFDEVWWDSKTMTLHGVDTRDEGSVAPRLNWIRWRLIDELLRRFYLDFGLEVGFGPMGVELYNDPIWSPNDPAVNTVVGSTIRGYAGWDPSRCRVR